MDTFLAVAESGNFNKAAEKLYITPTAVMKQMNTLEVHLGMKLIRRNKKEIVLTEVGESIQKDAKNKAEISAGH